MTSGRDGASGASAPASRVGADPGGGGHFAGLGYHASMVGDPHRMAAYAHALRLAVRPGMRVLDVGTGTGVLAVIAAQLGAREVVAVESAPVAAVAAEVFADNGVADRITLVRGDVRELAAPFTPDERFDVIVSDCLGRFVIDDFMLDPIAHVRPWLKDGGTFIPEWVELFAAPVTANRLNTIDAWVSPVLGIDLGSVAREALNHPFGAALASRSLLAAPASLGRWTPGERSLALNDDASAYQFAHAGELRGFAGWFEAHLGHGVLLSTAPGRETHWRQLLFPVSPVRCLAGDAVTFALSLVGVGREPIWAWRVGLDRRDAGFSNTAQTHEYGGREPFDAPVARRAPNGASSRDVAPLQQQASEHLDNGAFDLAADGFVAALVAGLRAGEPPETRGALVADAGLALAVAERHHEALVHLLSASGDLVFRGILPESASERASVEQAMRLAVDCAFRSGRHDDGQWLLGVYERAFGPHPAEWRAAPAT